MKRSVRLRLADMLDAIAGIEATVAGSGLADYARSWTIRRAVERGIEIISEASRYRYVRLFNSVMCPLNSPPGAGP